MEDFNLLFFTWINAGAEPDHIVLAMARIAAGWLLYGVPVLLTGLWLFGSHRERYAACVATMAIALGLLCNKLIGLAWFHPRPFMVPVGYSYMDHAVATSFPSNHAVIFFALGFALFRSSMMKSGIAILLAGFIVGWSRVYLGVHFPFDILGGLLVGMACVELIKLLADRPVGKKGFAQIEAWYRILFAYPIRKHWIRR